MFALLIDLGINFLWNLKKNKEERRRNVNSFFKKALAYHTWSSSRSNRRLFVLEVCGLLYGYLSNNFFTGKQFYMGCRYGRITAEYV